MARRSSSAIMDPSGLFGDVKKTILGLCCCTASNIAATTPSTVNQTVHDQKF